MWTSTNMTHGTFQKALFGEKEWYFFTPQDRKYPNGSRPNRAAGFGYWKATGADKPITATRGKKRVGIKTALVFFVGKAPKGSKTNWLMHEYQLADINRPEKKKDSLRLDDWVLCRIYNRKISAEKLALEQKESFTDVPMETINEKEMKDQPTSTSINHSAIEQSNPSFDRLSNLGSSLSYHNAVPPRFSPMNSNICFQNLDFFQNSTTPFSGSTLQAREQSTTFNPISSRNCNSLDLISGLHTDSSCSKPSSFSEPFWEEVESSFRLENFSQERQQSLVNFDLECL